MIRAILLHKRAFCTWVCEASYTGKADWLSQAAITMGEQRALTITKPLSFFSIVLIFVLYMGMKYLKCLPENIFI